jgi:ketosteroid isomerase-like protein
MRRFTLAAAVVLFAAPASAGTPEGAMMAADRAFNTMAQETGVPDAFAAYSAPANTMFSGDGSWARGPEAVKAFMLELQRPGWTLQWEPVEAHASPDGAMGYTLGRWTRSGPDKEGKPATLTGSYVTIWARQPDGRYLMVFDTGAEDWK